jgi:oligopeptide transport system substrate-binding protein
MSLLNYDLIRGSWIGDYADPTTFLDCFAGDNGNNRTGWRHSQYDSWLSEAAATPDKVARLAILRKAESLLVADEVPILPLFYYTGLMAFDPNRWGGIYPTPTDEHPLWAIHRLPRARVR